MERYIIKTCQDLAYANDITVVEMTTKILKNALIRIKRECGLKRFTNKWVEG